MMYMEEIVIGMVVQGHYPDPQAGEEHAGGFDFTGRVSWKYPHLGLVNVRIPRDGVVFARPDWLEPVL